MLQASGEKVSSNFDVPLPQLQTFIAAAATGSKTYMLRSRLDPLIIERAALSDEAIFAEEALDMPDDEDGEFGKRSYGSIIAWNRADQLAALGIMHVILVLVLLSGRVISDGAISCLLVVDAEVK
jgi:hypothetical protein